MLHTLMGLLLSRSIWICSVPAKAYLSLKKENGRSEKEEEGKGGEMEEAEKLDCFQDCFSICYMCRSIKEIDCPEQKESVSGTASI